MSGERIECVVEADGAGLRLDKLLAEKIPSLSRSRVQALVEQGQVALAGKPVADAARKVKQGERYTITIPPAAPTHVPAVAMDLSVVYEDGDLLVIDKPTGLTVHPAPGHAEDTLVNALLAHCGAALSGIGGVQRPGIVHRIDKDTSGLLIVAKHDQAHRALSEQLATRTLSRTYQAFAWGVPRLRVGSLRGNIGRSPRNRKKMAVLATGGKPATTHYRVLESFGDTACLVECKLETGRTHQIRVHMAHAGHPLVGDAIYGRRRVGGQAGEFPRQALHACAIGFIHPRTGEEMQFCSPLPQDMQELHSFLRNLAKSG